MDTKEAKNEMAKPGRKKSSSKASVSGTPTAMIGTATAETPLTSASVDDHFARALSNYKQKKQSGSTPASPLPLKPQSPRSSGRPAPYNRIRRTNSLPQMQNAQVQQLEIALSQLTGISAQQTFEPNPQMIRSLSANDLYNFQAITSTLNTPSPASLNGHMSMDAIDMSDIRQLEALLGAGRKQTLSSQAKNDSLFPLSEMEEDASSVLPQRPRSFHLGQQVNMRQSFVASPNDQLASLLNSSTTWDRPRSAMNMSGPFSRGSLPEAAQFVGASMGVRFSASDVKSFGGCYKNPPIQGHNEKRNYSLAEQHAMLWRLTPRIQPMAFQRNSDSPSASMPSASDSANNDQLEMDDVEALLNAGIDVFSILDGTKPS